MSEHNINFENHFSEIIHCLLLTFPALIPGNS